VEDQSKTISRTASGKCGKAMRAALSAVRALSAPQSKHEASARKVPGELWQAIREACCPGVITRDRCVMSRHALNTDRSHVPKTDVTQRRGLTREEVAAYCGCESTAAFSDWVRRGIVPGPIPGTNRWDRKAIDAALDRASGLEVTRQESPLRTWRARRARATQGHS
jgi:hypothetical protein